MLSQFPTTLLKDLNLAEGSQSNWRHFLSRTVDSDTIRSHASALICRDEHLHSIRQTIAFTAPDSGGPVCAPFMTVAAGRPNAKADDKFAYRTYLSAMQLTSDTDLSGFSRVESWIFDLDNTLYPADCNLFAEVDQRMGEFISEFLGVSFQEARRVQKDYYHRYGTTLAGLMAEHKLPPKRFLDYVHDIDLAPVSEAPALGDAIARLPGRKYIFTNGSRAHAERVATKLGILHHFDEVFDIVAGEYVPKPSADAYHRFLQAHGVEPRAASMFEDIPHNLEAPHALGMATVLVHSSYYDHPSQKAIAHWRVLPPHIHHMTLDLTGFLGHVLGAIGAKAATQETQ
jgi:putative hydrolase of the HAD superfamily